jgi:hypothetical protein
MNNSGWNAYVFRDGRHTVSGPALIASLSGALGRWRSAPEQSAEDCALASLIAAGELECALLDDAGSDAYRPESCNIASQITDSVALAFLTGQRDSLLGVLQCTEQLRVADRYEIAVQEGFSYYALHPRKVAILLDTLMLKPRIAVIGIRSIGVALSAVACAWLRLRGMRCERITVRPTGHPYDRQLELTPELCAWVGRSGRSGDADFLIVDEGPGISGSSFLAVAEAVSLCGVEGERIHMAGSREVDPTGLRATNAAERWTRYHFHVMQNEPLSPEGAGESLSGGIWRRHFRCAESAIPASWAPLEPAKFLGRDRQSIFKFEGFGHYGEAIGVRARLLAAGGFAPHYFGNRRGFGEYELVPGRMLERHDRSAELLERMADYLAFRFTHFGSDAAQSPEIETMLRWNWQLEFGEELSAAESRLRIDRVVVCDGRMMPHEWLRTDGGELLKLDAGIHGDNHFFPGPCDIAWDVAGAIVEWELQGEEREQFIREYERRSGDAITERLAPYLLAYTIFCMGWSKMAALAMEGEYDEGLLTRDYQRYREVALRLRQKLVRFEVTVDKFAIDNESVIADQSVRRTA